MNQATAELGIETASGIAAKCGVPLWMVEHAIGLANVKPAMRAGTVRLYGPGEIARIREAMASVKRRRTKSGGPPRIVAV